MITRKAWVITKIENIIDIAEIQPKVMEQINVIKMKQYQIPHSRHQQVFLYNLNLSTYRDGTMNFSIDRWIASFPCGGSGINVISNTDDTMHKTEDSPNGQEMAVREPACRLCFGIGQGTSKQQCESNHKCNPSCLINTC